MNSQNCKTKLCSKTVEKSERVRKLSMETVSTTTTRATRTGSTEIETKYLKQLTTETKSSNYFNIKLAKSLPTSLNTPSTSLQGFRNDSFLIKPPSYVPRHSESVNILYKSPYSGVEIRSVRSASTPNNTNSSVSVARPSNPTSWNPIPFFRKAPKIPDNSTTKKLKPGICIIFNHEDFDSSEKDHREGSREDVRVLKETFEQLKLKVNPLKNLTLNKINSEMLKIQNKDFTNYSCIVIVILSHGSRREWIRARDEYYSIDDHILKPILQNKTLETKEKILIIQACKGEYDLRMTDSSPEPKIQLCKPTKITRFYSTFEGYVSYRTERGSIFIQEFCKFLKLYAREKNVRDIMDLVIKEVYKKSGGHQIPSILTTSTEPYKFGDYV